jgi:hypothetical protein
VKESHRTLRFPGPLSNALLVDRVVARAAGELFRSARIEGQQMTLPPWASERIAREVDAFLQRPAVGPDEALAEAARRLRAWPVWGGMGDTLLLGTDGEIHCQHGNTMEVRPMRDLRWRTLAWIAAAEQVPELRALLPACPVDVPDCPGCLGSGRVQLTPHTSLWCGSCWGLGWQRPEAFPAASPDPAT